MANAFGITDTGLGMEINEDHFLCLLDKQLYNISEGLWNKIENSEFCTILAEKVPLAEQADRLIARANYKGNPDDIFWF